MLIAQITDLHIRADRQLAYGQVDTATALENAVAHAQALDPAPDVILFTGDIGDIGIAGEYDLVAEILAPLSSPWYMIPGNHDRRVALHRAFPRAIPAQAGGFLQYAVRDFPLHLIALDTLHEGFGHGVLCAERLTWLDRELARHPDQPTLIFMHHPPIISGIDHMDGLRLLPDTNSGDTPVDEIGAAGLAAVLARHGSVVGIICGHIHRPIHCLWHGVPLSVAPSVAHQVVGDFRKNGPAAFNLEPPAILLHFWSDAMHGQGLLTHTSYIGHYDGPYPFFDKTGKLIG
ncbi:phosphodiesterase [Thalassospira sp. NFXS8]|uniref:phosphodiesterase n=1 Tax=Thalassospira sp. NFXS8 TaxID=2819093 RepID=UPI0032DF9AAB